MNEWIPTNSSTIFTNSSSIFPIEFLIWDTKVAPKILVTSKKPMDIFYIGISKINKKESLY
jgi:hypothetical protein